MSAFAAPSHVVVTGAAGAIGAALARELCTRWPAVALALVDRDAAGLERVARELAASTSSPPALAGELAECTSSPTASPASAPQPSAITTHVADLADLAALPALVDDIARRGPIDGLVNCAGVMRVKQLGAWRWQDAEALLAIDLLAPLRLQDLVVRGMQELGRGTIVNVSSMAGRVPLRGCAYYGAAKAGLAMASEIARAELAPLGVRVVTVYPGPVRSALEQGARDAYGGGGLFGRLAPTGDPAELARKIGDAIVRDEPRVIYPGFYGVGWTAPNLSRWVALAYGPPPVA